MQSPRAPHHKGAATFEPIPNTNLSGTADRVAIRYATKVRVNGQEFKVAVDTGSSDLWIVPPEDFVFNATGIPVTEVYGVGVVNGTIGFATVELGGYTIDQQVFANATSVGFPGVLDIGLDGLIGLSFDGNLPSPLTATLNASGMDPSLGEPFLFNLFAQTPEQDNFIGLALSRTDDPEGSACASFTLNEVDETYAAVVQEPKIPLFPGGNGVWSMLMDGVSVDGVDVAVPPSLVSGTPAGKAVVILDTGTATATIPEEFLDAIFSKIPGAIFNATAGPWTVPCNTTSSVSVKIGGQDFPIHPLDLSDVIFDAATNRTTCIAAWIGAPGNKLVDMIWGAAFMRNVYSIFNFGNSIAGSSTGNASTQLLALTDPAAAAADALKVRAALLDTLPA
ncbi:aspartic peptidase domain-containing protein [Mycena capillaripes]|nr:aspartic peptidase domain-containing protein [Mycena capillaripes]